MVSRVFVGCVCGIGSLELNENCLDVGFSTFIKRSSFDLDVYTQNRYVVCM